MKTQDSPQPTRSVGPSIPAYELFMAAISILSIVNIFLDALFKSTSISYVLEIINFILSIIFFIDFSQRWAKATSKRQYFFHDLGWADLLACLPLPQFKIFRMFRLVKANRILRKTGGRRALREFFADRAHSALYLILFLILLLLEFGSMAILAVESTSPNANIHTASDAIWWVYVTITTVGYGDKYPVTNAGRVIGMFVMLAGVGLFGVLTGFLANKFLPANTEATTQLAKLQTDIEEMKSLLKTKQ